MCPVLMCCVLSGAKQSLELLQLVMLLGGRKIKSFSSEKLSLFCFLVIAELRICLVLSRKLLNSKLSLVTNAAAAQHSLHSHSLSRAVSQGRMWNWFAEQDLTCRKEEMQKRDLTSPPVFVVLRILALITLRYYVVAFHFAWWEEKWHILGCAGLYL